MYQLIEPKEGVLDIKMKRNITSISLLIVLLLSYSYWGHTDASNLKKEYTSKIITFGDISTDNNIYKYIGETSGYYFVLNSKTDDVLIANKEGIETAKVQPNRFRENEKKQVEKQIDEFFEKINYYLHINDK